MMKSLIEFGLSGAQRRAKYTGVWCQERKLVSIGIAVRSWVTYHGFAINMDPDLGWFARINPCGLDAEVMGSMASLGRACDDEVAFRTKVAEHVADALGRRLERS